MARGANTGRGNYPAARIGGSFDLIKKGIKGAPKVKFPNRHTTEVRYKKGLRKVEEGTGDE